MSDDYTPEIDTGIDVETENPEFDPEEVEGPELEFKSREIKGKFWNSKQYDESVGFDEGGKALIAGTDGKLTTPHALLNRGSAYEFSKAFKSTAARGDVLRLQEWLADGNGARSLGGIGLRMLAYLFLTGHYEYTDKSIRAVCRVIEGAEQGNLSKMIHRCEEFFGVECGHCRHEPKEPDPLRPNKKGKKKYECRACYAPFWVSASIAPEDVTCPKCKNHVNSLAMYCEDCDMQFLAPKSNPACPRCSKPGRKMKVPIAANNEDEEKEIDGNDESQQHAE